MGITNEIRQKIKNDGYTIEEKDGVLFLKYEEFKDINAMGKYTGSIGYTGSWGTTYRTTEATDMS